MKTFICLLTFITYSFFAQAQKEMDDYDAFEKIVAEVKEYRKDKLLDLGKFLQMAKEENTIILDTRSDSMYKISHLKDAVHLEFSRFDAASLAQLIPSKNTRILVYCNNNFYGDDENPVWRKKSAPPKSWSKGRQIMFPLTIPTYINLYGYGYKNIYELVERVSVYDKRLKFEGTSPRPKGLGLN